MGLLHLLAASGSSAGSPTRRHRLGSLAQPEARPAGRTARARLRSAPLPLPAPQRLRQTRARPPATPPRAANPRAGAGRGALTPRWLRSRPHVGLGLTPCKAEVCRSPAARRQVPALRNLRAEPLILPLQDTQRDHAPHPIFGEGDKTLWLRKRLSAQSPNPLLRLLFWKQRGV